MSEARSGRVSLVASLVFATVACNRTEEPQSLPAVRAPPTQPTVPPSPPTTEAAPRQDASPSQCLVQLPDEPAPTALPATECPPDSEGAPNLPRGTVTFVDAPQRPRVDVELARTPRHRERGLMFRTKLGENAGMLFSWEEERPRSFWMLNTCIPLDMLFIAASGTVVGVLEQVPVLNTASRSVACPAAHVLEVNAGWARAHGVRAGQKVRIDG